mmetsp:Transcript_19677/g.47668  ORF Transcript_19677/g.47668 Transcript_19677/m.47668 type:complete len:230 (+) Transcript_19677:225-914(+)
MALQSILQAPPQQAYARGPMVVLGGPLRVSAAAGSGGLCAREVHGAVLRRRSAMFSGLGTLSARASLRMAPAAGCPPCCSRMVGADPGMPSTSFAASRSLVSSRAEPRRPETVPRFLPMSGALVLPCAAMGCASPAGRARALSGSPGERERTLTPRAACPRVPQKARGTARAARLPPGGRGTLAPGVTRRACRAVSHGGTARGVLMARRMRARRRASRAPQGAGCPASP